MEREAFEKLYETYYMRIYSYVMTLAKKQYIAEEITQETFYKVLTAKNTFRGESNVMTWLCAIAGIFMIPVLVCLIVNLASGAALDWFFIVLASLLTAASLIIVPLMMPENKLLLGGLCVGIFMIVSGIIK